MSRPIDSCLRQVKLLKGLDPASLASIDASLTRRKLGAREVLIERDEPSEDVFFVLAGTLRVIIYAPNGKSVLFRDLGVGEAIGELSAIDRKPRSASVEALASAEVARLSGDAFRALVERQPALAMALLHQSIGYVRELTERVYAFSSLAVSNRIHAELLRLVRQGDADGATATLSPAPRQVDIADRISTHREAVSRELSHLARIGLIKREAGRLVVTDVARLARLVEDASRD